MTERVNTFEIDLKTAYVLATPKRALGKEFTYVVRGFYLPRNKHEYRGCITHFATTTGHFMKVVLSAETTFDSAIFNFQWYKNFEELCEDNLGLVL